MSASTRTSEGQVPFPDDGDACLGRGGNGAEHPGEVADHVEDHHKVVHIVVVGRGDVDPAAAGERADDACAEDERGEGRAGRVVEEVLQEDERETGAGGERDEQLEDVALGVPVADAAPISWVELR